MSYLPAKQLILLQSLQQLTFFSLLKLQGESLESYPGLLDDLIATRMVMEKFRPLDTKMQYQLERLTKMAQSSEAQEPTQYRPRPDLLEKSLTTEKQLDRLENEGKPEVYKPAKINPVYFESKNSEKIKKEIEKRKVKLKKSAMIREMQREASGAPEEISMRPRYDRRLEEEDKRIEQFEESALRRVPLSKEQRKRRKALHREAMTDYVRSGADFRMMEDVIKIQEGATQQEKERQEQNVKLKKLIKTLKTKRKHFTDRQGKKRHKSK
eukprot:TRINITY_DN6338_c0_g1_i3.p1 TRINITY_DN6338_c0_g1~~TRINITY_DN6338_c0_g1_i3.p1  ORF type:complete len:268 (+),score=105.05 TRINITY_DN6338_c0_g1_i3:180-983(+)